MTRTARQAADAFADAVGEDRANVTVLDPQWRSLLTAAVVVEVHATGWPAETTLTLDDLGIQADTDEEREALSRVVQLGKLLLLPLPVKKEAQHLRNKFRNALADRAIKSHWGALLNEARYTEWRDEALKIQAEYDAFAQRVYDAWDDLTAQQRSDLTVIGRRAYKRLSDAGRQPALPVSEWVERFVNRCLRKMITRDQWLASMRVWWEPPRYVPVVGMLEDEMSDEIRDTLIAQAKTDMERDVIMGRAQQFEKGLYQFVSDVRGEMASLVFNVCVDVLSAIKADEKTTAIPRNSSKQLRNLIDKVQSLKFWDDAQLDAQMAEIQAMLDISAGDRDVLDVTTMLQRIGSEARLLLSELDRPVERGSRHVGIDEYTDELGSFVREGRAKVELAMDEAVGPLTRQGRTLNITEAA